MTNVLLVFAGGGAGSVIRYLMGVFFRHTIPGLPLATFVSNISACAIFAFILYYSQIKQPVSDTLNLLIFIGFCGGLSTFSTFGYETFMLFKNGLFIAAILNIVLSITISLLLFYFALRNAN